MDSDDLAVLLAALYEADGRPYRFVLPGDGETWISVETVPLEKRE